MLTLCPMFPSYKHQSINLQSRSIAWDQYEGTLSFKELKRSAFKDLKYSILHSLQIRSYQKNITRFMIFYCKGRVVETSVMELFCQDS